MIPPSGRVPERSLDWFSVATEACGGETSDLGLPQRVLEYLGIYRAKRGVWEATGGGTNHRGVLGDPGVPWWVVPPSGHPRGAALAQWMSSGP